MPDDPFVSVPPPGWRVAVFHPRSPWIETRAIGAWERVEKGGKVTYEPLVLRTDRTGLQPLLGAAYVILDPDDVDEVGVEASKQHRAKERERIKTERQVNEWRRERDAAVPPVYLAEWLQHANPRPRDVTPALSSHLHFLTFAYEPADEGEVLVEDIAALFQRWAGPCRYDANFDRGLLARILRDCGLEPAKRTKVIVSWAGLRLHSDVPLGPNGPAAEVEGAGEAVASGRPREVDRLPVDAAGVLRAVAVGAEEVSQVGGGSW